MSDFFRTLRGIEIDEIVRIIQGSGLPGLTPDTDSSLVGSMYMDRINGDLYIKFQAGSGTNKWRLATSATATVFELIDEQSVTPIVPVAAGDNSLAIGSGSSTDVNAPNSIALGLQSLTRLPGAINHANGRFASTGDAQDGKYLLRTHTVNNSETELFIDGTGGTQRLILPDDSTWTFKASMVGHRTDASDGHAGYTFEGVIYKVAGVGSIAFVGRPTKSILGETNVQWDANIYADTTTGALKITCTGQTGKIIRWLCKVETVEVST